MTSEKSAVSDGTQHPDEGHQQQAGPQEIRDAFDALESDLSRLEVAVREFEGAPRDELESDGEQDTRIRPTRDEFETAAGRLQDLLAELNGGHGAINSHSGGTITPLDPEPAAINLDDIAHALSNLCRFTGHGKRVHSVARHAVHVSHEVEARGGSLSAQRWGLLHDASEAYLADVPAPVKQTLPGYMHAELRLQRVVRDAFGIDLAIEDERLVDAADSAIGRAELAAYFPQCEFTAPVLEYPRADLDQDTDAMSLFLSRAEALGL
ncbi:hypothetical protein C482_05481 [Natrialba chahannaoensis JCM 10990]|uniref:Metal dependent phosphohydrolase n=1 Tax=Natrialba chahannaoensis JCM 10990 TaxID=1227492 RepID=M0AV93_9EURY|nr:hypothetical protein [Natrialba chahannaoensis]ELZ02237.1 hypothetical protein C482_05481 [Natrialba chahannaoensis JCM 10990]